MIIPTEVVGRVRAWLVGDENVVILYESYDEAGKSGGSKNNKLILDLRQLKVNLVALNYY